MTKTLDSSHNFQRFEKLSQQADRRTLCLDFTFNYEFFKSVIIISSLAGHARGKQRLAHAKSNLF